MPELSKTDKILILCQGSRPFSEIKNEIGWSDGTTYNALHNLLQRGLVEKDEIGIYRTTPEGERYLQKKTSKIEDIESKRIDNIAYNAYYYRGIMRKKSFPVSLLIGMRDVLYKDSKTRRICDNIKQIYVNSVHCHFDDDLLVISTWADHKEHSCKKHDFDFQSSYDKYASDDVKTIDRDGLFNSLHRYSRIVLSLDKYWTKK